MKPYRTIPIAECGEALEPIPPGLFAFYEPHPYVVLGAPYGGATPWMLRRGVLKALLEASARLSSLRPGWKILIFDAYRPNAVQQYMVDREFALQAKAAGIDQARATPAEREMLAGKVFRLWGVPSADPATPPPHSTGGAIDCTLADEKGREVDMGSPIDENSDRSNPDYFADKNPEAHANRTFLNDLMKESGFHRLNDEWWHFALGDQVWAWLDRERNPGSAAIARYGRADLVK
jgi:D-alanyl-D-alanine dipeptidase